MGKQEKLIAKLLTKPKTFIWKDLCSIMEGLGFEILEGSGSRRKFINKEMSLYASWHEPHPGNEVKQYVIKEAIQLIKDYRNEQ